MRSYWLFWIAKQKAISHRLTMFAYLCLRQVYGVFSYIFPAFDHFGALSCYCEKQLDVSVFYASVPLLKINLVITLSKFTTELLACGSWFHSAFDNAMTQFIINNKRMHPPANLASLHKNKHSKFQIKQDRKLTWTTAKADVASSLNITCGSYI